MKKSLFPHTVKTVRPAGLTCEAQRLHQRHEDVLSHFSIYFVVFYCIFWVVCTCRLMWNTTKAECCCSFTSCQSGWKLGVNRRWIVQHLGKFGDVSLAEHEASSFNVTMSPRKHFSTFHLPKKKQRQSADRLFHGQEQHRVNALSLLRKSP